MTITNEQFETIYREYYNKLLKSSCYMLKDPERASDVVQECFLRLTKQEFEKIEGHIAQWLFTVCRNLALKSIARNKRYCLQPAEEFDDDTSDGLCPAAELMNRELADDSVKRLYAALATLKPRARKIIEMRYMAELSYKEIAKSMNLTEGNVGFIISIATRKLKKAYGKIR
jgi:RNA polymerase sigma factor (sigma-70 family)